MALVKPNQVQAFEMTNFAVGEQSNRGKKVGTLPKGQKVELVSKETLATLARGGIKALRVAAWLGAVGTIGAIFVAALPHIVIAMGLAIGACLVLGGASKVYERLDDALVNAYNAKFPDVDFSERATSIA